MKLDGLNRWRELTSSIEIFAGSATLVRWHPPLLALAVSSIAFPGYQTLLLSAEPYC